MPGSVRRTAITARATASTHAAASGAKTFFMLSHPYSKIIPQQRKKVKKRSCRQRESLFQVSQDTKRTLYRKKQAARFPQSCGLARSVSRKKIENWKLPVKQNQKTPPFSISVLFTKSMWYNVSQWFTFSVPFVRWMAKIQQFSSFSLFAMSYQSEKAVRSLNLH